MITTTKADNGDLVITLTVPPQPHYDKALRTITEMKPELAIAINMVATGEAMRYALRSPQDDHEMALATVLMLGAIFLDAITHQQPTKA